MFVKKRKNNINPCLPSSEELYVQNYFDEIHLKYIREYKINNLANDNKNYRVVDFYLPRLNIYVEYFGMYNSTKSVREEYDEKVKIYIKNNIPSVIIYPHELGFLDYAFHNKILKVLRLPKFKNKMSIFKYKLSRYLSIGKGYLFFMSLISFLLSLFFLTLQNDLIINNILFGVFLGFFLVLIIQFLLRVIWVFFYDY